MLRSAALALTLTFGFTGLAEAKHKTTTPKHKIAKAKTRKYKTAKPNKAFAKRRKQKAA